MNFLKKGLFCLLFSFVTLPAIATDDIAPEKARQKARELKQLRDHIESLTYDIEQKEKNRNESIDSLRRYEQNISEINRHLFELEEQQNQLDDSLVTLLQQTQTIREKLAKQQVYLTYWLRRRYYNQRPDIIQLVLNHKDPETFLRHLTYYGYFMQAHTEMIQRLSENLKQFKHLSSRTRAKYFELDRILDQKNQQKQKLQQQQKRREQLLVRLGKEIEKQRSQLSTLQDDEKRLTNLVDRIQKLLLAKQEAERELAKKNNQPVPSEKTTSRSFDKLRGILSLPVKNGKLLNRFGAPRQEGGLSWKGWFIQATAGTAVSAVADGRVVFANWLKGYGNLIILEHSDHYMSLYSNNESLVRRVGDTIRSGEKIATVGNSGGNATTGVYFELRHQGEVLNPSKWIRTKN